MKTIILPGFSPRNEAWAEEVREKLDEGAEVFYWPHWETGKTKEDWKEMAVEEILKEYEGEKINIVAKSVGTIVTMMLLLKNINLVNKLILCGIPVSDFQEGDDSLYKILSEMPAESILCFQNDNDPLAKYESIARMIYSINPDIEVISKPANTHEYPYFEEFKGFLK